VMAETLSWDLSGFTEGGAVAFSVHRPGSQSECDKAPVDVGCGRGSGQAVTDVFIVAGEPSGDLWGGLLVTELLRLRPELSVRGIGSRHMASAGVELLWDSGRWGAMGFQEVVRRIPRMAVAAARLKRVLRRERPRLLVLIDFGVFNMHFARFARRNGLRTLYYFPPSSWDRGERAVDAVAQTADYIGTPFPWSAERLRAAGGRAMFTGHPVLDLYPVGCRERPPAIENLPAGGPKIGVLSGSRAVEVRYILPQAAAACKLLLEDYPEAVFLVSVSPHLDPGMVIGPLERAGLSRFVLVEGSRPVLLNSDVAIVKSGSATLEAAAACCPFVTVYRGSALMWWQFRLMRLNVQYVAMPNIILQEPLVPELWQWEANGPAIAEHLRELLADSERREQMREKFAEALGQLGEPGASARAAKLALSILDGEVVSSTAAT